MICKKEKTAETCYSELEACVEKMTQLIKTMRLHEKVQALNKIRRALSECSPFQDPVDLVEWIPAQKVQANDYNPPAHK